MAAYVEVLRISTAAFRLRLEAKGPGVAPTGVLNVSCTGPVDVWTSTGSEHGFALWEQTDYRLTVEPSVPGQTAFIRTRSPAVTSGIAEVGSTGAIAGILNLGSLIGILEFEVGVSSDLARVALEVVPTKLDYGVDFTQILREISRHSERLLFRYFQATHLQVGSSDRDAAGTEIDWLAILRGELRNVVQGIQLIERSPVLLLDREVRFLPIPRIRRPSAATIAAIRQAKGKGSWGSIGSVSARERLPADSRQDSRDTPEHRWIQGNLQVIELELDRITSDMATARLGEVDEQDSNRSVILAELLEMSAVVRSLRRSRVLAGVTPNLTGMERPSTALLTKLGYSQTYRSLRLLRHVLAVEGTTRSASVGALALLYEQWCFLEVIDLVQRRYQPKDLAAEYFEVTQALLAGRIDSNRAAVFYGDDALTVRVAYNPVFPTLTGDHKPDITVTIERKHRARMIILLDAKYRRSVASRSVKWPGPGANAVNAMHRYRDAVVAGEGEDRSRPVTQAIALFPANVAETQDYEAAPLYLATEEYGVGALPFLPSNRKHLEEWLTAALDDPDRLLRISGPPTAREADRLVRGGLPRVGGSELAAASTHGPIEAAMQMRLLRLGISYSVNSQLEADIPIRADIVLTRPRIAVFVDDCESEGCPEHGDGAPAEADTGPPNARTEATRDAAARLASRGWQVMRFWGHQTEGETIPAVVEAILARSSDSVPIPTSDIPRLRR